jgi:hypothetical protein
MAWQVSDGFGRLGRQGIPAKVPEETEMTERRTLLRSKRRNDINQRDGFDGQNGLLKGKVNP